MRIVPMAAGHAEAVLDIYQDGLDGGHASFELRAPTWAGWDTSHLPDHWYVAVEQDGAVVGWAALTGTSDRCVYAGVAETSVYVAPTAAGRGVGTALLVAVIDASEQAGTWTLQAGIFPENAASIRLHERVGFRIVGRRVRLGQHHGAWRDVLLLERRSSVVGG